MRNVGHVALVALALLLLAPVAAEAASRREWLAAKTEQLAMTLLPTNEFHEALGFFGPVTKKYLPVFEKFNAEYLASTNRLSVIRAYWPKTQEILKDAEAMKVSEKYEAKKAEYLGMFRTFLTAVNCTLMAFGKKED